MFALQVKLDRAAHPRKRVVARASGEMNRTKATFPVGVVLPFPDFLPLLSPSSLYLSAGSPINNATAKRIDEKLTLLQRLSGWSPKKEGTHRRAKFMETF